MEGKPTFSGAAPESHPIISNEVKEWREKLGDPPWVDKPVEAPAAAQPETVNQTLPVKPEAKSVIQETQDTSTQASVGAIDEALTDSKADISAVQTMMSHFIEVNNGKDA